MKRFMANLFGRCGVRKSGKAMRGGTRLQVEALEARQLLTIRLLDGGLLEVVGTTDHDRILIDHPRDFRGRIRSADITVSITDLENRLREPVVTFRPDQVRSLLVLAGAGSDEVTNDLAYF